MQPSFNILIATIGRRPGLQRMLDSLIPQLNACDHITIVFDDVDIPDLDTKEAKCQIHIYHQTPNLGAWGHGIRNKYANKLVRTDFVMHADDDDIYIDGAFDKLRDACKDINTLYIGILVETDEEIQNPVPPAEIRECLVGTPSGIIPYNLNTQGFWMLRIGGDGFFYEMIKQKAKSVEILKIPIYRVRP
jgi:glycosyltransferase involved in cell wall biosynthesis